MGYPKIEIFDKLLIERTIQNIDHYSGNFEFTHLINSLLALIVLPHEYCKRGHLRLINDSFLKKKVFEIEEIKDLFLGCVELTNENDISYSQKHLILKSNNFNIKNENELLLVDLLRKLRNGIAHYNIRPARYNHTGSQHENSYWKGVIIRNYPEDNDGLKWNDNFTIEVYLNYEDLKRFSKFIAQKYLDNCE
ncbi:MAG: HEPN family nuclease [Candidatus Hodarchaeales archaeon]